MRSTTRTTLPVIVTFAVGGLLSALQAVPAGASGRQEAGPSCPAAGAIAAERVDGRVWDDRCELVGRRVEVGTVRLRVPLPGNTVGAAAVGLGPETELVVTTFPDGDVAVQTGDSPEGTYASESSVAPEEPCDKYGVSGCLPPCADTNFHTYRFDGLVDPKVRISQPWFFKASTTPPSLTRRQAVAHLKQGSQNVVTGANDCGLPDPVSQTAPYKGTTSKGTGISVDTSGAQPRNVCGQADGANVVDFGPLASAGLACWRAISTDGSQWFISEADIRLKKKVRWTATPDEASCYNRTDIQGVMTHERGHTFGLSHADYTSEHVQQTMFPVIYPCTSYARTLGLGDHSGLDLLYD